MLEQITWEQFLRWIDYSEIEPWDELRADYRAAQIERRIASLFLRKGDPMPRLDEFMLRIGYKAPAVDSKEQEDRNWDRLIRHAQLGLLASKQEGN